MTYFQLTGKAEQTDESTYTIQSTGEIVTKIQLTLNIPGMNERVLCEMPLDVAPKPDILEQWEMEESWLVVSASSVVQPARRNVMLPRHRQQRSSPRR
jgi:hypothetical protein